MNIVIVGDVSNWNIKNINKRTIPAEIKKFIGFPDLFIFNLEGPIIPKNYKPTGPYNLYENIIAKLFSKDQPIVTNTVELLKTLTFGKINLACLANNHILDAGEFGINNTIKKLKKYNYQYVEAGKNLSKTLHKIKLKINNDRVVVYNINLVDWKKCGFFYNIFGSKKTSAGTAYLSIGKLKKEIEKTSEKPILVLQAERQLRKISKELVKKLSNIGAYITVIYHPHTSHIINKKYIYSVGDFIFNYPNVLTSVRNGMILKLCDKKISTLNIKIINGIPTVKDDK